MNRMQQNAPARSSTGPAGGFTLIEFIVALVVIAGGAALLTTFVTPTARSADPMIQAQARAIATAYMDEILLRDFDGPCGTSRAEWEGIQCYNNLPDPHPPQNQFGVAIGELSDYQVSVSVGGGSPATITVNVTHPSGAADYTLQSQRGNY